MKKPFADRIKAAIQRKLGIATPNPGTVVFYLDQEGKTRWRLLGSNGEIVLPQEQHASTSDAVRAIATARRLLNDPSLRYEYMEGTKLFKSHDKS